MSESWSELLDLSGIDLHTLAELPASAFAVIARRVLAESGEERMT